MVSVEDRCDRCATEAGYYLDRLRSLHSSVTSYVHLSTFGTCILMYFYFVGRGPVSCIISVSMYFLFSVLYFDPGMWDVYCQDLYVRFDVPCTQFLRVIYMYFISWPYISIVYHLNCSAYYSFPLYLYSEICILISA